jgi:ADP-ribose pyrophosphatase YjhB (NUDIX family)
MKYCGECGMKTERKWIEADGRLRDVCESCGITHYQNPRVIVASIVHCADRVLMCRRAQEPGRGQWFMPTGYLECGETMEECAARETREDTGIVFEPADLKLASIINLTAIDQISIAFRIELDSEPVITCGPECLEAAFMAEERVLNEELAWRNSLGTAPGTFFQELRSGMFTIKVITVGTQEGAGFKTTNYSIGPAIAGS